jgi:hypothetical protein
MTATINPIIHNTIAESILHDLITKSSKYYYFLGKTLPYNTGVEVVETPTSDYKYELSTRREIIELKQITASDVSYVVPRYDWVSGTVYSQYDDIIDISSTQFYVLTDEYNIYKCLDNNYDSSSTVKPTGTDTDPFKTSDGYKWKFVMSMPLSLRNKFLSLAYMPVTTAIKSSFYNNGGIDYVTIENGGSGYVDGETIIVVQSTTGINAELTPIIEDGSIAGVIIENAGEGYTYADLTVMGDCTTTAILLASTGQGNIETIQADVELLAVSGAIDCIKVINNGANYGYASVIIDGDGTNASAEAVIDNGVITGINIIDRGYGYTYATVTINGNGAGATARAIMSPIGGHGKDAITELYANTLVFFSNISTEKNQGMTVSNDFRQFGIVKNPRKYGLTEYFNQRLGSTCYVLNTSSNTVYFPTDSNLIDNDGKRFKVIAIDTAKVLVQSYDNAVPVSGSTLTNTENGQTLIIQSTVDPTVDKYSGKILYIDNRAAFFQTEDQSISFQTVIKF